MKKGKIALFLSLGVLSLGAVGGSIAYNHVDLFGNAAAGVVANGTCGLTFNAFNKPTLEAGKGSATSKHVSLSYKNAEAAGKKEHVKLLKDGEMYTTGVEYNGEVGSVVNGLTSVTVTFTADAGADLHVLTSFDGKTWDDAGALLSGIEYKLPETQVPPRLMRLVAKNGAVTIVSAGITCTAEDAFLESQKSGYQPKVGKYIGTVNVDEGGAVFSNTIFEVTETTVTVPVYDATAGTIALKPLYRAGYGSYWDDNIDMEFKGDMCVEDLNGKERGMTVLARQTNEGLCLYYNMDMNFNQFLPYTYVVNNAKKYTENTKLDITLDGKAINDGDVIATKSNVKNNFEVKNTIGTSDAIVWSSESKSVTIVPTKDGKSAAITFTAESGDAVINVKCGKVAKSFTLHVEAASVKPNPSDPHVVDFPTTLNQTKWVATDDTASVKLVVEFNLNGYFYAPVETDLEDYESGYTGYQYDYPDSVISTGTAITVTYNGGATVFDFTPEGLTFSAIETDYLQGEFTDKLFTQIGGTPVVFPVEAPAPDSKPETVVLPEELYDTAWTCDSLDLVFGAKGSAFTMDASQSGTEVESFDMSQLTITKLDGIVTIAAANESGVTIQGITVEYDAVKETITGKALVDADGNFWNGEVVGAVLTKKAAETANIDGKYTFYDEGGTYELYITISGTTVTVEELYNLDPDNTYVVKSFDGTTLVIDDSIGQTFGTFTYDASSKKLTVTEWGSVASFGGTYISGSII